MTNKNMKNIVIDATGLVIGRLATQCAKEALRGHSIEVLNIEKAVISGNPKKIITVYKKRRTMTNHANPEEGAKWPRRPDYLFKKILSGMTPNSIRGKLALRRVKAHLGDNGKKGQAYNIKNASQLRGNHITLGELSTALGWAHG